jgi:hypothetical protein
MRDWRARMESRRIALETERTSLFRSQKAERAKMEDDKAEKRRRAAANDAAAAVDAGRATQASATSTGEKEKDEL